MTKPRTKSRVKTAFVFWVILATAACRPESQKPTLDPPKSDPVPPVSSAKDLHFSDHSSTSLGTVFRFHEATQEWKLDFTRFDDAHGQNLIQEAPGGGVALFDYDLDGELDVFLTQGSRLPRTNVSREYTNEMFRNVENAENKRVLERVTSSAGVTSHGFHTGCTTGDIDEDGFPDLYVTAYGRSSLWHNNGDGTFQDISSSSNCIVDSWSTSAGLADFNGDGLLDLFVTTYIVANDDPPRICKSPTSPTGTVQCSPNLFPAHDDVLFINDGQGGFVDVTHDAGIVGRDGKGLGVVIFDVDADGHLDIFVANDATPCFLYRWSSNGTTTATNSLTIPRFEECGAEYGVALNGQGQVTAAMGIAHGDYDRDGWIDMLVTNFYLEPNTLFRNLNGRGFVDMSTTSRLGPPSRKTLAFGTEFLDVDHDGWLDLIVTTGHVEDQTWAGQVPYKMRPHLFRNEHNGRFTDIADRAGPYFSSEWVGRGLAVGDLDRDGDLDIVVSHQAAPSSLLLNETPSESESVIIRLVGRGASPRSGIGTRVLARKVTPVLMRGIGGGGSFQSASALEVHFGLAGKTTIEELEFTWPDGHVDRWGNVTAGFYVADEGRGLRRIGTAAR